MATHEDVKEFNREINSILAAPPPISRAKMASITKAALKAQNHYKHVVMLVEKFIAKCQADYKVPGLYIVDSIVRQSKHIHKEKDVFGPRFARNLPTTFTHIFKCKAEDTPRVIKVLNLWQMNKTFDTDVIQPLHQLAPQVAAPLTLQLEPVKHSPVSADPVLDSSVPKPPVRSESSNSPLLDPNIQTLLQKVTSNKTLMANLNIREKAALDSVEQAPPTATVDQQMHVDPNNHQTLATEQPWPTQHHVPRKQSRWNQEEPRANPDHFQDWSGSWEVQQPKGHPPDPLPPNSHAVHTQPILDHSHPPIEPHHMRTEHPHPHAPAEPLHPAAYEDKNKYYSSNFGPRHDFNDGPFRGRPPAPPLLSDQNQFMSRPMRTGFEPNAYDVGSGPYERGAPGFDRNERIPVEYPRRPPPPDPYGMGPPARFGEWPAPRPMESRWGRWSPRRRRSRSPRSGRSRSRSPGGKLQSPRRRTRRYSRSPRRHSSISPRRHSNSPKRPLKIRSSSIEKEEVSVKKPDHVTVYSTTIWVGHIKGTLLTEEFRKMLEQFGPVSDVEVITLRGCAYVTMANRKCAQVVHKELKDMPLPFTDSARKHKNVEVAWAPGRGTKGSTFKEFWTLKSGVSVIPWTMVKTQDDLDKISLGGEVDSETLPPGLRLPQSDPAAEDSKPQNVDELQPSLDSGGIMSEDLALHV